MDFLTFLYLVLFPFGKLTFFIPDLLVGLIILSNINKLKINALLIIFSFSIIFSLSFFTLPEIFTGILYLIRFATYIFLGQIIYEKFGKNPKKRELIINSLILVGIFVSLFGWLQYFIFPDIRFLKQIGWDDHYFRLVSTFLDPAFTGILLVLSEILVVIKTIQKYTRLNLLLNLLFVFTILFTYSRASFLALFLALIFLFIRLRNKFIIFIVILFTSMIFILPNKPSEGTNLVRTYSVNQKLVNYSESFDLIKKSPIFGIGFDNICVAKNRLLKTDKPYSHTCSGLDNSILVILATSGIIGFFVFFQFILKTVKNTKSGLYRFGLFASFIAVFVHGMFTNTFFYNFVLGWFALLIGVTRSSRVKSYL